MQKARRAGIAPLRLGAVGALCKGYIGLVLVYPSQGYDVRGTTQDPRTLGITQLKTRDSV